MMQQQVSAESVRSRAGGKPCPMLTAFGRTQSIRAWAAEMNVPVNTIRRRLDSGHTPEAAVSQDRPYKAMRGAQKPAGAPGAASWTLLEWREDPYAQRVVNEFGRLSLDSVGVIVGVTRMRVQQIEAIAVRKLRIARELVELMGWKRGARLVESLRGEPLSVYRAQLAAVRERKGE